MRDQETPRLSREVLINTSSGADSLYELRAKEAFRQTRSDPSFSRIILQYTREASLLMGIKS